MAIELIFAVSRNQVIGIDNDLPWRIPADLKRFKQLTEGQAVVMGRNTWESLPRKPLKERANIIVSKTLTLDAPVPGTRIISDPNVVGPAMMSLGCTKDTKLMVIGGAELYKLFLPLASKIHCTYVDKDFYPKTGQKVALLPFPINALSSQGWCCDVTEAQTMHRTEDGTPYTYFTYNRILSS